MLSVTRRPGVLLYTGSGDARAGEEAGLARPRAGSARTRRARLLAAAAVYYRGAAAQYTDRGCSVAGGLRLGVSLPVNGRATAASRSEPEICPHRRSLRLSQPGYAVGLPVPS